MQSKPALSAMRMYAGIKWPSPQIRAGLPSRTFASNLLFRMIVTPDVRIDAFRTPRIRTVNKRFPKLS